MVRSGEPERIAALRRDLGTKLATFRLAAGLTQARLAQLTFCDRTTIAHAEKGRARGDERFWAAVDDACQADGELLTAFLELTAAKADQDGREHAERLAAAQARAAQLRSRPEAPAHAPDSPALDGVRRALLGHPAATADEPPPRPVTPAQVESTVADVHRLYQLADYDGTARALPPLLRHIEHEPRTDASAVPVTTRVLAYLAAAKLATKLGDAGVAWVAGDRCLRVAAEANLPSLIGLARYQVACALLAGGHPDHAEQTVALAEESLAVRTRSRRTADAVTLSVHGSLLLLRALLAARRGDVRAAISCIRDAVVLAETLGRDANHVWTAFSSTNAAIHELSVHVSLGNLARASRLGETINLDGLPAVLRGRRSQVHLELATVAAARADDGLAVLHLLEAERVARQAVSRNAATRHLLNTLLARERRSATPGLRALAARAGLT